MNKFLPFSLPDIGNEEISEVVDTLRSGWLTSGPKTERFEQDFSRFIGGGVQSVAVNSATAGLHLALEAIGVGPGDQIITIPYTFTATAEVIRYIGADPVFVDIDPKTYNIDAAKIESAITPRVRAIIPVHFSGLPCGMDKILKIAKTYKLKVIEDAAHALPSIYKGKLIGSLQSDATIFSFYATKPITTGEGGMIVTRNPQIAHRCRIMRLHGIYNRFRSKSQQWRYEIVAPGFKYNTTDIASSLGIHQLKKTWAFHKLRSEIADHYEDQFRDLPIILPPKAAPGNVHAWHLYVIGINKNIGLKRDLFIRLMARKGIGCSVHFIPLHIHPYWRNRYKFSANDFPNSMNIFNRSVSLPLYAKMKPSDQKRVIKAVREIILKKQV